MSSLCRQASARCSVKQKPGTEGTNGDCAARAVDVEKVCCRAARGGSVVEDWWQERSTCRTGEQQQEVLRVCASLPLIMTCVHAST